MPIPNNEDGMLELNSLSTASKQGSEALSKVAPVGKEKSLQEAIAHHKKINSSNKK